MARLAEAWDKVNRAGRDTEIYNLDRRPFVFSVFGALAEAAGRLIRTPMAEQPRYYITTAISYPNGPPHIGHAYEVIATDAIARFMRLDGYDVFFLTGTDEHGQKIQQTATQGRHHRRASWSTATCRASSAMVERMNCSNDDFIRTTEERHHRSSQAIWQRMEKNGDIYLDKYAGWYSVRDEAYYAEDETHVNEHKVRHRQQDRHAGRMGGGGELFLQALGLPAEAARPLCQAPRLRAAEGAAERGRELRAGRPAGPLDLAHHLRLGHQGARAIPSTSCTCGSTR